MLKLMPWIYLAASQIQNKVVRKGDLSLKLELRAIGPKPGTFREKMGPCWKEKELESLHLSPSPCHVGRRQEALRFSCQGLSSFKY